MLNRYQYQNCWESISCRLTTCLIVVFLEFAVYSTFKNNWLVHLLCNNTGKKPKRWKVMCQYLDTHTEGLWVFIFDSSTFHCSCSSSLTPNSLIMFIILNSGNILQSNLAAKPISKYSRVHEMTFTWTRKTQCISASLEWRYGIPLRLLKHCVLLMHSESLCVGGHL